MFKGYRPDFRNVLITPKKSSLRTRKEVNLNTNFTFKTPGGQVNWCGVPIISSNMDTVSNLHTCQVLRQHNYLTCFPKHFNKQFDNYLFPDELHCVENYMLSCGTNDYLDAVSLINRLKYDNIKVKFLCVDIANGYIQPLQDTCKILRNTFPDIVLAAGNVVTPEIVEELIEDCGVNIVKVGIGSGSVCETRLKTGVGYPQLSAVIECSWAAESAGGYIISDGGITSPSDICKAFAGGANFVMVGGMFAGHSESPGDLLMENGETYKLCYGMSSKEANEKYNGGMKDYRTSEGKVKNIKLKCPLEQTIKDINGGIRSACTYVNARNIPELSQNAEFTLN